MTKYVFIFAINHKLPQKNSNCNICNNWTYAYLNIVQGVIISVKREKAICLPRLLKDVCKKFEKTFPVFQMDMYHKLVVTSVIFVCNDKNIQVSKHFVCVASPTSSTGGRSLSMRLDKWYRVIKINK